MPNQLAQESSPYLLQHKDNPVDWYPWGPEALERARREDRPIFLSIGYSACHWCHVMEHESFENPEIARMLNDAFVCIKVDREERPDLDQIYMNAVQLMTGHGGWPMSVFLTPDLKPFFGGTYWPPRARLGMPGFDQVIQAVEEAWRDRRQQAEAGAEQLTEQIQRISGSPDQQGELSLELLDTAVDALERVFDRTHGGFGRAPKFPHPMDLQVLLRVWHRRQEADLLDMVRLTLDRMARGGIYDHLGGGFARYSVDARWLVPHFEKMLYDNALLSLAYLEGYLATGNAFYAQVVRETLDYVLRDMTDPEGSFYSTEDADSEGEEGKFYVWTPAEIVSELGTERAEVFCRVYDVTEAGNFEGRNILNMPRTLEQNARLLGIDQDELARQLAEDRQRLFAARAQRVHPGKDDKVLVAWNGLMIDAMAQAAQVLDEPRYAAAAQAAADFIHNHLRRDDDRLLHTWRHGVAKLDAYLDDYAAMVNAFVSVYEASFDEVYLERAMALADQMLPLFAAPQGGFYYTAADHETLITRTIDLQDSSVPSGNALAATGLLRLGKLTGRADYLEAAVATLQVSAQLMEDAPAAAGQMLLALDRHLGPTPEIVILGDVTQGDTRTVVQELFRRFIPNKVVAARAANAESIPALQPLFEGKAPSGGEPTIFLCENFACQAPISGKEAILAAWDHLAGRL